MSDKEKKAKAAAEAEKTAEAEKAVEAEDTKAAEKAGETGEAAEGAENAAGAESAESTSGGAENADGAGTEGAKPEDAKPEDANTTDGDAKSADGDEKPADEDAKPAEEKPADAEDEALNMKYMRLMADFQNFKRRTEKEKSDIYAFANEKLISELLNVIDSFERALATENDGGSFYQGMEMILKQLLAVLEKAGVSEIKALGEDFDPNFHNAVMTEDSDSYESGKVTEVLQKGYILNNRVIRPSMVKVAN